MFNKNYMLLVIIWAMLALSNQNAFADISDQLSFSTSDFDTLTVLAADSNYYSRVTCDLPKQVYVDTSGYPDLPAFIYSYSLSSGDQIDSVTITSKDSTQLASLSYSVYPRQSPQALCYECSTYTFNSVGCWYDSTQFPKSDEIAIVEKSYGFASGLTIGTIIIRPICYNITTSTLWLYSNLSITMHTSSSGDSPLSVTSRSSVTYAKLIENLELMVENPDDVESDFPVVNVYSHNYPVYPDSIPPDYLIITSEDISEEIDDLSNFISRNGFRVEVKTVEDIETEYTGSDTPEQIRNYIKDMYVDDAPLYALLLGDMDIIPMRYYGDDTNPSKSDIPTDLYYACIDGDWDENDPDLLADVYVGRVAVSDTGEVSTWIEKLIRYNEDPGNGDDSYLNDVIMATADQMLDLNKHELIASRFPYWFDVDLETLDEEPSGDDDSPTAPLGTDVVDELSDPSYGIFYGNCHGSPNWFAVRSDGYNESNRIGYTTDSVRAEYTNWGWVNDVDNEGRDYVHFSISCYLGALDCDYIWDDDPPPDGYGFASCFAEDELLYAGGAVGGTYNTRVGWVSSSSYHEAVRLEWLFGPNSSIYGSEMGPVHYAIKSSTNSSAIVFGNTLFGDPSMFVYGGEGAKKLTADYPSSVVCYDIDSSTVTIQDSTSGVGIPNVLVTFSKDDEIYERGYTNTAGAVSPILHPTSTGWITVTCRKGDYVCYVDSIEVISYCADAVAGDANGDGSVLGGDVTFLVNYFQGSVTPPDSCMCPDNFLYHAADANGDCSVLGGDVTYLVNYFKGGSAPEFCTDCPTSSKLLSDKEIIPTQSYDSNSSAISKTVLDSNKSNIDNKKQISK